jgi:hypothetical protein
LIASVHNLRKLREADDATIALAVALNKLESYIYGTRDAFENNEDIPTVATPETIELVKEALQRAEDWLYDNEEPESPEKYNKKLAELQELADPVFFRRSELTERPKVLELIEPLLKNMKKSLAKELSWQNTTAILESIDEFETWLKERQDVQEKQSLTEDPAFTSIDVRRRMDPIVKTFEAMKRRIKPKPKPKPKASSNSTSGTNETTTEEEPVEQEQPESEQQQEEGGNHENAETGDENAQQPPQDDDEEFEVKDEL